MKIFLLCFSLYVVSFCSDRPSRERFPGPQGRTTDLRKIETQRAVLGGFDSLNNPLSEGGSSGGNKKEESIHGVIQLGKNVVYKDGMTFFISIRKPQGGPPLAVKRESNRVKFPYEFQMSSQDAMIPGTRLEGELVVTARISASPDPLARSPGDASGKVVTRAGTHQGVQITIDDILK